MIIEFLVGLFAILVIMIVYYALGWLFDNLFIIHKGVKVIFIRIIIGMFIISLIIGSWALGSFILNFVFN